MNDLSKSSMMSPAASGRNGAASHIFPAKLPSFHTLSHLRRNFRYVLFFFLLVLTFGAYIIQEKLLLPGDEGPDALHEAEVSVATGAWNTSWSVVVAHAAPLTCLDAAQEAKRVAGQSSTTVLRRAQLPSWTLHAVDAACTECMDTASHAAAVRQHRGNTTRAAALPDDDVAVFATPSAPLGLAGPMLFAMASVTDDVAVGAELARWSWVPRSYAMRRQFAGAVPAGLKGGTSPYLVVMGIPSTDQPVRSSLRDAQRATWLAYHEVARSSNDFHGALLPLYIFAAAERGEAEGVSDVSPLMPTVSEYEAASSLHLLSTGAAGIEVPMFEERRVQLVKDFGKVGAGDARFVHSPCERIVPRVVGGAGAAERANALWSSQLATALSLPARPAAVAPAEYICYASTALWQEALAHRNVLWVDMMTDRRPTVRRALGEQKSWGLPVEVAMTQKLILWLQYAYQAFPDVPYIMKGDDDIYMKVPQFLRDIRHIRSDFKDAFPETSPAVRDPPGIEDTEECIYWGSIVPNKRLRPLRYQGGMGYLVHRRMVQATMELSDKLNAKTVRLAVLPYSPLCEKKYTEILFNAEDAFVGRMLRDKVERLKEICPFHRTNVVDESRRRVGDKPKRRGRMGYAASVVHHVTPYDIHFLHYYFKEESKVAGSIARHVRSAEARAKKSALKWMMANHGSDIGATRRLIPMMWHHPGNAPAYVEASLDHTSVYNISYHKGRLLNLNRMYSPIIS